jgi:hypothetical protein
MSRGRKPIDPIERFHAKYIIDEETGCWEWVGYYFNGGYPGINIDKKMTLVHRFSYQTFIGPLIDGLVICHNCNNKKCVNYNHLRQDTQKSNCIDKSYAKTMKSQILTVEQAIEIKNALKNPYYGIQRDLAKKYGLTQQTICDIKKNRHWSHI